MARRQSTIVAIVLAICCSWAFAGEQPADSTERSAWPGRVLITNDDGIEDEDRLIALARAFHRIGASVFVAVPAENRSGTTHLMSLASGKPELDARRLARHETARGGPATAFYVVDGYPADCVVLALAGPMREDPPDLVVSGINGGANLAEAWIGSGTIGAARIAAYAGIPALAVSGIDDSDPSAAPLIASWVAELAQTDVVRNLPRGGYLTIGLPEGPIGEIRGLRVAPRNHLSHAPILTRAEMAQTDAAEVWQVTGAVPSEIDPDSDLALHAQGYVVLTPMRADEHDWELLDELAGDLESLPKLVDEAP